VITRRRTHDAVVVGAGHNGLVAAFYLGRAGLKTLLLERREVVGGACVTEEIAPGCRASTASYIASMLRPEVIRDMDLPAHGLRMVPCDPYLQVPFPDGTVLPWRADRERLLAELRRLSPRDALTWSAVDERLKRLARYLQPFFLEPPPDPGARGVEGLRELLRLLRRFWGISGREIADMASFLTGSLGEFLDRHYESDRVKTLVLANSVYGKHGGPYDKGTALGLLFHLLSGGEHEVQGFMGHVLGGMGAITQAMAAACRREGVLIRTSAEVAAIVARGGRVRGVALADGTEIEAPIVLSNADPKRTFLGLVEAAELPAEFREAVRGIKMDGPCAKVNLVLAEEPRFLGTRQGTSPGERSLYTLVPSLEFAERSYDQAKLGRLPEELWVDCVVASNVDDSLAPPGRHVMTCFVQYVPYRLRDSDWDRERERLGDLVLKKVGEYAPNVPPAVLARQVLTPLDLERTYGLTEGNIFHGDLSLEQLFFMRPVPGWAGYRSPVEGLYLCGAGAHPGGGVTGAPGYNAARRALADTGRRAGSTRRN
jgi:phytoene dehydrogenase-like protein